MTAEELRSDLEKRGARLRLVDDRLRCEAPEGTLTDTDKALLTEHKPVLLALLRTEHERQTRLADHLLSTRGVGCCRVRQPGRRPGVVGCGRGPPGAAGRCPAAPLHHGRAGTHPRWKPASYPPGQDDLPGGRRRGDGTMTNVGERTMTKTKKKTETENVEPVACTELLRRYAHLLPDAELYRAAGLILETFGYTVLPPLKIRRKR